jgi:hypothetical protein
LCRVCAEFVQSLCRVCAEFVHSLCRVCADINVLLKILKNGDRQKGMSGS